MKKILLFLIPFTLIILLAGCKSNNELNCEYSDGSTLKIVYNDEEVLKAYEDGIKFTDEDIENLNTGIKDYYSTIDEYIQAGKAGVIADGGTCEIKD